MENLLFLRCIAVYRVNDTVLYCTVPAVFCTAPVACSIPLVVSAAPVAV